MSIPIGTLEEHGFLDIAVNSSLSNICDIIPQTRQIAHLGREQTISGDVWRFLDRSLKHNGKHVGWHMLELYKEGTYGKIYKAYRMIVVRRSDGLFNVDEEPHDVIVKQTQPAADAAIVAKEEVAAHIAEAFLHVLAWRVMSVTATPWAVPRPYEVYGDYSQVAGGWKSMSLCMAYVQGRTMQNFIEKYWSRDSKAVATRSFLEMMAQIAYILHVLQRDLRLNHRDVKVNNVLIRRRPTAATLTIGEESIVTNYEMTLIDFGFACVGCQPPRAPVTTFQAGSWFPMGEICCKDGRDLAQLLYCIHCYFPLNEFLTPAVYEEVKRWLQIPWSGGVADGFHGFGKDGRPRAVGAVGVAEYNTGIYEFLRRSEVDPVRCEPVTVFKECRRLLAELLG
jgi:serine/threonine protein kinase